MNSSRGSRGSSRTSRGPSARVSVLSNSRPTRWTCGSSSGGSIACAGTSRDSTVCCGTKTGSRSTRTLRSRSFRSHSTARNTTRRSNSRADSSNSNPNSSAARSREPGCRSSAATSTPQRRRFARASKIFRGIFCSRRVSRRSSASAGTLRVRSRSTARSCGGIRGTTESCSGSPRRRSIKRIQRRDRDLSAHRRTLPGRPAFAPPIGHTGILARTLCGGGGASRERARARGR